MKIFVVFTLLLALSLALPQGRFQFPRRHNSPRRIQFENASPAPEKTEKFEKVEKFPVVEDVPNEDSSELEEEEEVLEEEEEIEEEEKPQPVLRRLPNRIPARVAIPEPVPVKSQEPTVLVRERTPIKPKTVRNYVPNEYEIEQNKNAQYEFNSNVEDNINDQTQTRSEVRDGLTVKGMYSYSDGYFRRTVHYEADDKGYRIVSMESEPLDGPHVDLNGEAQVSNDAHGATINYRVQSVPVEGPKAKIIN